MIGQSDTASLDDYVFASGKTITSTVDGYVFATSGVSLTIASTGTVTHGPAIYGGSTAANETITNYGDVTGGQGVGIYLKDGGTIANGSASNGTATIYGVKDAILITGAAGTLTNFAHITSKGAIGVAFGLGGSVTNGSVADTTAQIYGYHYGVNVTGGLGTVVNFGRITSALGAGALNLKTSGIRLLAGGSITNGSAADSGALIEGDAYGAIISGGLGTVTNFGKIVGTNLGISLGDGGFIENGNTADSTATIKGNNGVTIAGGTGTIVNYGAIIGEVQMKEGGTVTNAATGIIGGPFPDGIYVTGGTARITNLGKQIGRLDLGGGGSVVNGSLTHETASMENGGQFGVVIRKAAGTVSNFGTIGAQYGAGSCVELYGGGTVTNGSKADTTALIGAKGVTYGVYAAGTTTVTNYGTIEGGVIFDTLASGVLVLEAGSKIVDGAGSGDHGTLEFGAGNGAGTITDNAGRISGSTSGTFYGFSFYDFAAGSHWTLTGTNIIETALEVGGDLTVAGSLTFDRGFSGTGTIDGAGTLAFGASATIAGGGPILNVAHLSIAVDDDAVTLNENLAYAGQFSTVANARLIIGANDTLTLTGTGSTFNGSVSGTGTLKFGGGTQTIGSGAALSVSHWALAGTDKVTVSENLTFAGALADVAGSSLTIGASRVLTLSGAVTGTGTIAIGTGASLNLESTAASTELIAFTAKTGTLEITDPAGFGAGVQDFAAGDKLDIHSTKFAFGGGEDLTFVENAAKTKGTLTIKDGTSSLAIVLFGQYSAAGFHLASDGHGGSLVTYTAPQVPRLAVVH
jgi:hypothetical protein